MSGVTASVRAIWKAVRTIPRGRVASYGEVAALAGLPGRARLAGHALRRLPAGSDVPWHRVVRADGSIAFAPGSEAHARQVAALRGEGVAVVRGRVDREARDPRAMLDALLWAPPGAES